jgi:hypothetical protein
VSQSNRVELTGRSFGRWTVLHQAAPRRGRKPEWHCRCACGVVRIVPGRRLLAGLSTSCGCRMQELARERRPWARRNLRGLQVGDLLVLRMGPSLPSASRYHRTGHTAWICRCRCGREVNVSTHNLTDRDRPTTHCGCRRLLPEAPPASTERPVASPPVTLADDMALKRTTSAEALRRFHDEHSPLGRVRIVSRSILDEPTGIGKALTESDSFEGVDR